MTQIIFSFFHKNSYQALMSADLTKMSQQITNLYQLAIIASFAIAFLTVVLQLHEVSLRDTLTKIITGFGVGIATFVCIYSGFIMYKIPTAILPKATGILWMITMIAINLSALVLIALPFKLYKKYRDEKYIEDHYHKIQEQNTDMKDYLGTIHEDKDTKTQLGRLVNLSRGNIAADKAKQNTPESPEKKKQLNKLMQILKKHQ